LIARIIFQPLEETLQLHFSRSPDSPQTRHLLTYILHISSHLLLFLPAFLPPILPVILPLLLPARYRQTTAPATLEAYLTYYVPLMSLNGILEAFHASSASPAQIARQARWMIGSSGAFAGGLWVLGEARVGSTEQCLVYASCLSMVVRIVYAGNHARQYFKKTLPIPITDVLPHPTILAIAAVGAAVVRRLDGINVLLGVGGFGLIALAAL